jgi:hypothetical protein
MTITSGSTIALFFLLFSAVGGGQSTAPKDVDGWTKAKWGMSEQEIRLAFAPDIKTVPYLGLDDVKVDNLHFAVKFWIGAESNKLIGVRLTNIDKEISTSSFVALEKALVQKYGPPTRRSNGARLITVWEFPSSVIEMHYGESPLIGHYLLLNYNKTTKQGRERPAEPASPGGKAG